MPGYGARVVNLVAARNRKLIAGELSSLPGIRSELARVRLERLDELGRLIRRLEARLAVLVGDHPLLSVPGIRALTAAKLIAETGDVRRFRSADAFAMLAGTAPIPASSGQTDRVRLNRGGNRQLNRALHMVALAQANHHAEGKSYVTRKRAEGKTWREAIRALKRHLARVVFRVMRRAALAVPMAA
jgi:transposase